MSEVRSIRDPRTGQTHQIRVGTRSVLIPSTWLSPQQINARRKAAEDAALLEAFNTWGDKEYNVRDLNEADFNVVATQDWIETTSSTGAWTAAAFATGATLIRDNTIIAIYGARITNMENEAGVPWGVVDNPPPVTGIRISIGGKRVAEWSLSHLIRAVASTVGLVTTSAVAGPLVNGPDGFADSPVVVTKEKSVTVSFWETATTLDFIVPLLGAVIEPVGGGQGALSP